MCFSIRCAKVALKRFYGPPWARKESDMMRKAQFCRTISRILVNAGGGRTIAAALLTLVFTPAWAAEITVGPSGDYTTIQAAIDAASDNDEIIVSPGTYPELIAINGKDIVLRSLYPYDPVVVANTIIDADSGGNTVTFTGTEPTSCTLMGFTIREGATSGFAGAINGNGTLATICNNLITANSAKNGGGLYACNGIIDSNIIQANTAENGAGLYACNGIIQNNVILDNAATYTGGGLYACNGIIQNNTIFENYAGTYGGGLTNCTGAIRNCIFWGNSAATKPHLGFDSQTPSYCCIQDYEDGGTANITSDPRFTDTANDDYHLKSNSPCIDAGMDIADLDADYDGDERGFDGTTEIRGDGSDYDIGADEYAVDKFSVVIAVTGSGTTDPEPGLHRYTKYRELTITAISNDADYRFDHWANDANGSDNPLTVSVDSDLTITAVFVEDTGSTTTTDDEKPENPFSCPTAATVPPANPLSGAGTFAVAMLGCWLVAKALDAKKRRARRHT